MEKLFVISFKLRYGETSEWGTEYIKAQQQKKALNIFAKIKKIPTKKFNSVDEWSREEGVWLAKFRGIKQVKETICPHCNGSGIIHM